MKNLALHIKPELILWAVVLITTIWLLNYHITEELPAPCWVSYSSLYDQMFDVVAERLSIPLRTVSLGEGSVPQRHLSRLPVWAVSEDRVISTSNNRTLGDRKSEIEAVIEGIQTEWKDVMKRSYRYARVTNSTSFKGGKIKNMLTLQQRRWVKNVTDRLYDGVQAIYGFQMHANADLVLEWVLNSEYSNDLLRYHYGRTRGGSIPFEETDELVANGFAQNILPWAPTNVRQNMWPEDITDEELDMLKEAFPDKNESLWREWTRIVRTSRVERNPFTSIGGEKVKVEWFMKAPNGQSFKCMNMAWDGKMRLYFRDVAETLLESTEIEQNPLFVNRVRDMAKYIEEGDFDKLLDLNLQSSSPLRPGGKTDPWFQIGLHETERVDGKSPIFMILGFVDRNIVFQPQQSDVNELVSLCNGFEHFIETFDFLSESVVPIWLLRTAGYFRAVYPEPVLYRGKGRTLIFLDIIKSRIARVQKLLSGAHRENVSSSGLTQYLYLSEMVTLMLKKEYYEEKPEIAGLWARLSAITLCAKVATLSGTEIQDCITSGVAYEIIKYDESMNTNISSTLFVQYMTFIGVIELKYNKAVSDDQLDLDLGKASVETLGSFLGSILQVENWEVLKKPLSPAVNIYIQKKLRTLPTPLIVNRQDLLIPNEGTLNNL